jgi:integrase/recombinase XerC
MMKKQNYQAQRYFEKNEILKRLIGELPEFTSSFFRGIENTTSILTRVNYAYELRLFFHYLCFELKLVHCEEINKVTVENIKNLNSEHIEKYLEYSN